MKDKAFIINSIKMDLFRMVTAVGDINKEMPTQSVIEFMEHAKKDFEKTELTAKQKMLHTEFMKLIEKLPQTNNPHLRLRWAEDAMTIRCRL